MRKLVLAFALLLICSPALATTFYVDGNAGDDTANTGLQTGAAFATVGYAASTCSAGDVIWINRSSYPETLTVVDATTYWYGDTESNYWPGSGYPTIDGGKSRNYNVTWNVATVTISGFNCQSAKQYAAYLTAGADGATIDDCTLELFGATSDYAAVYCIGDSLVFRNNYVSTGYNGMRLGANSIQVSFNTFTALTYDGVRFGTNNVSITDNRFENTGNLVSSHPAIYQSSGSSSTIARNTFVNCPYLALVYDNTASSSSVYSNIAVNSYAGFKVQAAGFSGIFANNYLANNTTTAFSIQPGTNVGAIGYYNNIVYNNTGNAWVSFSDADITVAYNDSYGNADDEVYSGPTSFSNLTTDPLVASANDGDLWSGSPCFTSGTDAAGLIAGADFTNQSFTGPIIGPHTDTAYFSPFTEPGTYLGATPAPTLTPANTPSPTPRVITPTTTPTPTGDVTLKVGKSQFNCGTLEFEYPIDGTAYYYTDQEAYYSFVMPAGSNARIAVADGTTCGNPVGGAGWQFLRVNYTPGTSSDSTNITKAVWFDQTWTQVWGPWMTPTPAPSPTPCDARYRDKTGVETTFYLWCNKSGVFTCFTGTQTSATDFKYILDANIVSDAGGPYAWYRGQFGSEPRLDWVKRATSRNLMTFDYPTPTPTPTPPTTPTPTATPSPSPSPTPSTSPTPTPSITPTPQPPPGLPVAVKAFAREKHKLTGSKNK